MPEFKLNCVLFDLDGTLIDTAPDLIASLNQALIAHDFKALDYQAVQPLISHGVMAMINQGAGDAEPELKTRLLELVLDNYEANIAVNSRLYAGISESLAAIEALGLKWGVVTNKRQRFTQPLLAAMGLSRRAACIVSGDSTANPKPHADPMLAACKQAGVLPENCVYIGDAAHDIVAGKSVNMKTLAAVYGYLQAQDQPETWGADALIAHPQQIIEWVNSSLCL